MIVSLLSLLVAAAPCSGFAPADCIAAAEEDYVALRYEAAAKRAETLVGDDVPQVLRARAHRVLGQVDAIAGRDGRAEEHFLNMLLLDGDASLPKSASPKIRAPFERAAARADDERAKQPAANPQVTVKTHREDAGPHQTDALSEPSAAPPVPMTGDEDEGTSPLLLGGIAVGVGAVVVVAALTAAAGTAAWYFLIFSQPAECKATLDCVDAP